jgi:hypothetical protein
MTFSGVISFSADILSIWTGISRHSILGDSLQIPLICIFLQGTYSGELPFQRFGAIDGSKNYFSPFGSLKNQEKSAV